jgi:acyl carrier protein
MNREELRTKICGLLKQIAPDTEPETLKDNDKIREVLGIDSFDALQFIVALDEHLGVDVPEKDYAKTDTLEHLLNYLGEKIH